MVRETRHIEPGSNAFFDADARAEQEAINVASFLLSLRARGIRDTTVLRAMELVPREIFAPRRFTDLARKDVALPLPCGQTMTVPKDGRLDARSIGGRAAPSGARDRHRKRLRDGTPGAARPRRWSRWSVERWPNAGAVGHRRCAKHRQRRTRIEMGDGLGAAAQGGGSTASSSTGPLRRSGVLSGTLLVAGGAARRRPDDVGIPRLHRSDRTTQEETCARSSAGLRLSPLPSGSRRPVAMKPDRNAGNDPASPEPKVPRRG